MHTDSGRLRDKSTTAIDLALPLHPTPAVGGVPTKAASELIAKLEGDRGFYAGAVGWCDASGDGHWVVAIRCAQLSADRRAAPQDIADITDMIHALAEFERAPDQCTVTETQISAALFGNSPTVRGHVAEVDGELATMALWFVNFSTWDGVAGIYLEDLFVRPRFRRRGLARALLAGERLDNGYTRLSWAVLN